MTVENKEAPERQEVEALLPWYAAGTLNRRDRERVERAIAADSELALRFALIREEQQETIHLNESLGVPSARAMEKLFAAIEVEGARAPVRRSFDLAGRISEFLSGCAPRTIAYAAAGGTVALFAQAAVLTAIVVKDQPGGPELMSASNTSIAHAVVRFTPHATVSDITRFLNAHNAVVVDGPKRSDLYSIRLAVAGLTNADITRIVQRMQSESKVVEFIAKKE